MTEEARISELLKPRRKVIAGYPGGEFEIGDILVKDAGLYYLETSEGLLHLSYPPHMIEPFPHLFREMQWHEERKPEEMPEYLKFNEDRNSFLSIGNEEEPEIHKVKRHQATSLLGDFRYSSFDAFVSEWKDHNYSYSQFLPARKTEYDQYIKTKQK